MGIAIAPRLDGPCTIIFMRIQRINARHLRLPPTRSRPLPLAGAPDPPPETLDVLVVEVETDSGLSGVGFFPASDAASLLLVVSDVVAPRCLGEDARHQERLFAAVDRMATPSAQRAYAAIDVALWDLKGKSAGEPLWRLWGGCRDSARLFFDETSDPRLTSDEVIQRGRSALAQGFCGLRVGTAGIDAEAESHRLVDIRDALGDDCWFAVGVERPYDYETALPMTRFIDEEIGADWFEDPLADDDLSGYRLLTAKTETSFALGRRFSSLLHFRALLEAGVPYTLRPSWPAVAGLTPLLKLGVLAEIHRRSLVPHVPSEIAVHLACGLANVPIIAYDSRLTTLVLEPTYPENGRLVPPSAPGLGVKLNPEAVERFTLATRSRSDSHDEPSRGKAFSVSGDGCEA